ncbi:MAG: glycosyl hydrolase family 28-related protein, partial [Candidatus Brocadiaceae bacterium]
RRGPDRPRIVLAPNSPGFDDPANRKYVVHYLRWDHQNLTRRQPNGSFNQMFVGIDIAIGEGNPGAVGIRHRGAQGSGVQDCTIDATHGFSGIEGACGSGGSHINVTVIGGRIGADLLEAQPAPTITGFTLIGQTETALRYRGYETLTAVGLRVVTDAAGPAIVTDPNRLARDLFGQLSLVDSSIEFRKPGPNVAIEARTSLYMQNVFVKGAGTVARHSDGAHLPGAADGWLRVREYAHGIDPPNKRLEYEYKAPVYVDGQRLASRTLPAQTDRAAPPADLQSRHLWTDPFPSWESPGAVNVKAPPYSAAGDNEADDADALQRAIDEHDIVFLPRGKYRVSRTLRLRPATKLVGVHRVFSVLTALATEGGDFSDPAAPMPVVRTSDEASAPTVLAFLGISAGTPGAYCLDWRAGRSSIFRAVEMWASYRADNADDAPVLSHPQAVVRGSGGGRWYNFHADHRGSPHPAYRHLLVEGTTEPLRFYQCNPEHSRGEANMELRNARNVCIYGLKGENPTPILVARDTDNVSVFGYGGNAIPPAGESLLLFERTSNFLVANLVDRPMGVRGDPTQWAALIERTADGRTIATQPLDRPVLYIRRTPTAPAAPVSIGR